ncbi:Mov34/MPN/PAD-1 family protein [Candidatus Chloroploca sp. Khr17]|uniref:Mov34/MPN/PAD-1 family protein n=1 Tax=Candidatus Chloroploca sp. Khr17 TaxID=2496869 RepID=UPI00101DE143|nr:Mov34/MPN/PAD-1 family protein [Candidatus Chloroploca sp. Khr17]
MPVPNTVYLAQQDVYQRMYDEACTSPGRETGGILVGRMFQLPDGLHLVVVAASGPGSNADRRAHTYAPDALARQRDLETWRQHYATYHVDYVGEWHKHPPGLHRPSSGDTLQVVDILSDESYHLPHGIFTPLVTIEDGTFLLHGHYYPRETMSATPVPCELVEGDLRVLLDGLVALEQQTVAPKPPHATSGTADRWGVNPADLRAARANLHSHPPVQPHTSPYTLDVEPPDTLEVIDLESSSYTRRSATDFVPPEIPPFSGSPPDASIPPIPPLPGRFAREQQDLEQYCQTLRSGAHLEVHTRDDNGVWYTITFTHPPLMTLNIPEIIPAPQQTPEGMVNVAPVAQTEPLQIKAIKLDPGSQFPQQAPEVQVVLSDDNVVRIVTEQLFPGGWRTHIRLRDVVRNVLETLTQPRPSQRIGELLEFQGRLIVRQVELACRSAADLCAEFNRSYVFPTSVQPDQGKPLQ